MLIKPAVLLIEKADSLETIAGEKGEVYAAARELIRTTNDSGNPDKLVRVLAISERGVLKSYRWKPAPEPAKTEKAKK